MSVDDPRGDPRLRRAYDAYQALRGLFEAGAPVAGGGGDADAEAGPWRSTFDPFDADPWLVSATDLLLNWAPEPFVPPSSPEAGRSQQPSQPSQIAWDAYFAPLDSSPPAPSSAAPRQRVSLEEPLDDAAAFAAAECLYELVHALGRLDVDAAMAVVSEDYCAVDADREVDHGALRHRFEALVDELRGGEVEVALAQVPEPITYRDGIVLIPATLQIDRRPPGDGALPASRLFEWIVVLEETAAGFRICALGPRRDRPSDPLPLPAPPFAARPDGEAR